MLLVEDRVSAEPGASPDAGVIEDARSRERRERRGVAGILAVVLLAGVVYALMSGGGGDRGQRSTPVSRGDGSNVTNASARLPRGRTSSVITIHAPADHAYDVTLQAPSRASVVLATNTGFTGSQFNTLDRQICRTKRGSTTCIIHFAAGGNQGGTWKWTLTKLSTPPARIHLRIAFAARAGDFPG